MSWWVIVFVVAPAAVVWALSLVDVLRRDDLPPLRKLVWVGALLLFFPLTLLYLLSRPVGDVVGEARRDLDPDDRRVQLVELVEAHDAGRMSDAEFHDRLAGLLGARTSTA